MSLRLAKSPLRQNAALQNVFWKTYDLGLASLLLFTISDAFLEMGLSSYQWLLCYVLLMLRIIPVLPKLLDGIIQNWVLLLFSLVCFASVLWSDMPKTSLISSIQFLITMLFGLWLGLRFQMPVLVRLLFWTSFVLILLSALQAMTGIFPVDQFDYDGRIIGVFVHKSYLARQALICTLAALALLLSDARSVRGYTLVCAALAPILSAVLIVLSESMTNLLMLPLAVGCFAILCHRRFSSQLTLWAVGLGILALVFIPIALASFGIDPIGGLLDATGKDRTLTGRTVIWGIAFQQIELHPFIGIGFGAFWDAPQYAAQRFQILSAGATSPSLHNFVLEILVGTGLLGLSAAFVFVCTAIRQCYKYWRVTQSESAAFSLTLVLMFVTLSLNTPGLSGQHEIQFILLTACAVSARRGYLAHLRKAKSTPN